MNVSNKYRFGFLSQVSAVLLFALPLGACQQTNNETNHQVVDHSDTAHSEDTTTDGGAQISTKTQFPQYVKGLPALLHPITPISISDDYEILSSIKSRDKKDYHTIFEKWDDYKYRSHMSNLVFENKATGKIKTLLPNNDFMIHQVFLPYTIRPAKTPSSAVTDNPAQTKQKNIITLLGHVIYHINETPYVKDDNDKPLSSKKVLYMSDDMGNALIKLHPDNEFVQQTKWMPQVSRYYFITQSDSNNDGMIDEKDAYHNYEINFTADKPVVRGYEF